MRRDTATLSSEISLRTWESDNLEKTGLESRRRTQIPKLHPGRETSPAAHCLRARAQHSGSLSTTHGSTARSPRGPGGAVFSSYGRHLLSRQILNGRLCVRPPSLALPSAGEKASARPPFTAVGHESEGPGCKSRLPTPVTLGRLTSPSFGFLVCEQHDNSKHSLHTDQVPRTEPST